MASHGVKMSVCIPKPNNVQADDFYVLDVFRLCGGARCAHNLVPYEFCRRQALSLVKQLLLSSGGDDDMGTLLALMQKEPHENIQIKIAILRVSSLQPTLVFDTAH